MSDPITAVTGGSAILSAGSSIIGGNKAAKAQTNAANNATAAQMDMFNRTQENLAPYMQIGGYANNALMQGMGLTPQYDEAAYNRALDAWNGIQGGGPSYDPNGPFSHAAISTLRNYPGGQLLPRNAEEAAQIHYNPQAATPGAQSGASAPTGGMTPEEYAMRTKGMSPAQIQHLTQLGILTPPGSAGAAGQAGRGPKPMLTDFALPYGSPGAANPFDSPLLKSYAPPTAPKMMTQDELERTPGYQFNMTQGLKAVQNSAARRGLGNSGAAYKGAANYATGLADSTYQQQFGNQQTLFGNQQQIYQDLINNQGLQFNKLSGIAGSGQNAAAGLGTIGANTAGNIGNNLIGAGNAAAGSYMNAANAVGGAANMVPNYLLTSKLLSKMNG